MSACSCDAGLCSTCACSKSGRACTDSCHGGRGLSGNSCCLNFAEAQALAGVPVAQVRKELARGGLDCIGNPNELKRRLGEHQRAKGAVAVGSAREGGGAGAGAGASSGADALIKAVLARADDPAALLSLGAGGLTVSASTPEVDLRRAYLRLSLKIHPDKNGGSTESKAAFQALVSALEHIGSALPATKGGPNAAAPRSRVDTSVSRSNDGCVQTRIECPRCQMDWPRKELGLEDGAYNFFMTALKEYVCGLCMLTFGCMSATHRCLGCKSTFEYSPSLYHTKVQCGKCARRFGFMQFPVSARRLAEVKVELAASAEERMRRADARARREGRAALREGAGGADAINAEALFCLELLDACPRCGSDHAESDGVGRAAHLAACVDTRAHAAHAASAAASNARAAAASARASDAADATSLAVWDARGRVLGTLWALSRGALVKLCKDAGLSGDGEKVALIRRFRAAHTGGGHVLQIEDAGSAGGGGGLRGPRRIDDVSIADADAAELPSNLETLDAEQLAAVCASYGLAGDARDGKSSLLKKIERARFAGRETEVGLLADGERGMEHLKDEVDDDQEDARAVKRPKK